MLEFEWDNDAKTKSLCNNSPYVEILNSQTGSCLQLYLNASYQRFFFLTVHLDSNPSIVEYLSRVNVFGTPPAIGKGGTAGPGWRNIRQQDRSETHAGPKLLWFFSFRIVDARITSNAGCPMFEKKSSTDSAWRRMTQHHSCFFDSAIRTATAARGLGIPAK